MSTVRGGRHYFTARAVRLDEESSKLLILAPHNDTIDDLEGKLGAPAPNYPPTLFDFYLVCIYRRYYLPTNCDKFQYTNSQGNTVTPVPQGVSTADIHRYITGNEALKEDLQSRASISLIVELATSYPRGFATYCTVSNQYAPSASEALPHYFSRPRCLPSLLLPLQLMPETW